MSWSRYKARLDAAAGVTGWRIHDLRRTFSTGMNELGADPHIVEAILGHKIRGVAGVYNKAKHIAAKRAAVEAWGAHVLALVEGRDPGVVLPMRGRSDASWSKLTGTRRTCSRSLSDSATGHVRRSADRRSARAVAVRPPSDGRSS